MSTDERPRRTDQGPYDDSRTNWAPQDRSGPFNANQGIAGQIIVLVVVGKLQKVEVSTYCMNIR